MKKIEVGGLAVLLMLASSVSLAAKVTITIEDDSYSVGSAQVSTSEVKFAKSDGVLSRQSADLVLTPTQVQQSQFVQQALPAQPAPPPLPSASDAADPRRLVRYFCRLWKDESYEAMYWAMTDAYRAQVPFKNFKELFEADAKRTGGLKDENIVVDDVDEGKTYTVTVDLRFNYVRANDRRVKATLEKTAKDGYRIRASGIIPVDLDNL